MSRQVLKVDPEAGSEHFATIGEALAEINPREPRGPTAAAR
ncbi:hypothetical protein OG765_01115 [Streptomyces sp. NBC_00555]|nr:hypothetical protein [Streptomyces sp. NBC_00555]MCX5009594.1 hypothetical protein [Streptomyces sp. NBC_00555]